MYQQQRRKWRRLPPLAVLSQPVSSTKEPILRWYPGYRAPQSRTLNAANAFSHTSERFSHTLPTHTHAQHRNTLEHQSLPDARS